MTVDLIHILGLMQRKPGVPTERFLHHWEHVHLRETGAADLERMPYFWYRQNHALVDSAAAPLQTSTYDGWADFYFENLLQYYDMRGSARVKASKRDEKEFQAGEPLFYATRDNVLLDGDAGESTHKLLRLFRRRFDVRADEFRERWRAEYGQKVLEAAPQAVRYVQAVVVDEAYLHAQPRWDGFDILWLSGDIDSGVAGPLADGLDDLLDLAPPPAIAARELVPAFMQPIFAVSVPESVRELGRV